MNHTVVLNAANTLFTGEVAKATAATRQIIFELNDGKNAAIGAGSDTSGAIFRTATPGKGALDFTVADKTVYSVGEVGKALENVIFTESGTITNGAFAETFDVKVGKTATLGGTVGGTTGVVLEGAGSTVKFSDKFTLDTAVTTTVGNKGVVEFTGGGFVNKDIAKATQRAKTVIFSDDLEKVLNMNADVYATEATIRKAAVKAVKDTTIDVTTDITLASSTLDVSGGNITLNGANVLFRGDNTITVALIQSGNKVSGKQVINSTGTLKFAADTTLFTNFNDADVDRPTSGVTYEVTVLKNNGVAVLAADALKVLTVKGQKDWIKWTSEIRPNGDLVSVGSDNSQQAIANTLGSSYEAVDAENVKLLAGASTGSDALKFYDGVIRSVSTDKDKLEEAFERLRAPSS